MVTPSSVVEANRIEFQQRVKNEWNEDRLECLNYYDGLTESITRDRFSKGSLTQVPVANNNITRRVIDRVSLVYMVPPIRTLTSATDEPHTLQDEYARLTAVKDLKLQRAEKYTNLLRVVAVLVSWDARDLRFNYQVLTDFEPEFVASDPFRPTAINYPISTISSVRDVTPETWRRWDADGWDDFTQADGSQGIIAGNDVSYGILPAAWCFRDGVPETEFLDVAPAKDLIDSNHAINVALTNKNANTHFQSFGKQYITGVNDASTVKTGQDTVTVLPDNANMGILSPPDTLASITASVQSDYKSVAQNYGLDPSFVEGNTAESGVALRIRNQELTDARRSDVVTWRNIEAQIYEIEIAMLKVHQSGRTYPDTMSVDYSESIEVLTPQEQRDKDQSDLDNGFTTRGALVLRDNPDQFIEKDGMTALEQAEAWTARNRATNTAKGGGTLIDALNKPLIEDTE